MSHQQQVREIIKAFSGQANTLTIPRPLIPFMGSLEGALLLSQIIYWSDRCEGDWFYKTYADWEEELSLSEYQVRKAARKMEEMGFLETAVRKARGNPTLHYRLDWDKFSESFLKFLQEREQRNLRNEGEETAGSIHTEITPEPTTKPTTARRGARAREDTFSNQEQERPTDATDATANGRRAAPRVNNSFIHGGGTAQPEGGANPPSQQAVAVKEPPPPTPSPLPMSDGLEEAVAAINRELATRPGATPLSRHDMQALVRTAREQGRDGAALGVLWGDIQATATAPAGWLVKWVIGKGEWRAPEARPQFPRASPASGDKGASKMCRIDTGSLPEEAKTKIFYEVQARQKEAMRRGIGLIESADFMTGAAS